VNQAHLASREVKGVGSTLKSAAFRLSAAVFKMNAHGKTTSKNILDAPLLHKICAWHVITWAVSLRADKVTGSSVSSKVTTATIVSAACSPSKA
jgi:hypothetical protein